jgi:hypothetical protein
MQNRLRLLYLLALLKFSFAYLIQHPVYELHRDEMLYLAEGKHMAWGFMEVPPLLSVFAWLTHLLGDGVFWVKFWPSLFGALTFLLVGKIIISLEGKGFALLLGWLPFMTGAYLRVHYLFQPNFLEIFFWTAMAYCLVRYQQDNSNKWLYWFGICAGLGMLSKYSVLFFILSLTLGLLLTKERKLLRNKHFYYAAALAFLIFLPNFIWQYNLHFPVIYHMNRLRETQLQYISPSSFLIDQFIMNLPVFYVWLAGLIALAFSPNLKNYRFLLWAYLIVISLLLIGHGKNYYALGAYPVLFAFGAYRLEKITSLRLKPLRYLIISLILVLAYFSVPILIPIFKPTELAAFYKERHLEKTGALRWEDLHNHPLPQDFSDMLGWKEMADKMAAAYNTLDSAGKKTAVLFCDDYGQAGAVNYYGRFYHLPEAYSDNASFFYWIPDSLKMDNLILLTDDQEEMSHPFIHDFKSAVLFDSITSPYARERGDLILILKGADSNFHKLIVEKFKQDREKLGL